MIASPRVELCNNRARLDRPDDETGWTHRMERLPADSCFSGVVAQLQKLLSSSGHSDQLVWLFREDFYHAALTRPIVRYPLPPQNLELAERHFEAGRAQGWGVQLRAQFEVAGQAGCTLWFPDAFAQGDQNVLQENVLSVASPLVSARLVRSPIVWWVHCLRPIYRANQAQGFDIPLRADLR